MEQLLHGDLGVVKKYYPHAHQGFVITTPCSDIPLSKGPLYSFEFSLNLETKHSESLSRNAHSCQILLV